MPPARRVRFRAVPRTSQLHPSEQTCNKMAGGVSSVPIADLSRCNKLTLIDDLVGASEQLRRNFDAERLCCLEIYQQDPASGNRFDGDLIAAKPAARYHGGDPPDPNIRTFLSTSSRICASVFVCSDRWAGNEGTSR